MKLGTECIVIFPVYKSLNVSETACLQQAIKMTSGYRKVFIAAHSFELDDSFLLFETLDIIRFPNHYFANIEGYNQLMLAREFYAQFERYEYMLIHQTDAYLFKPTLHYWCNVGYDYIGAPWHRADKPLKVQIYSFLLRHFPKLYPSKAKKRHALYNVVGNGGLSLRRIISFGEVLRDAPSELLESYNVMRKNAQDIEFNEDVFWSIEAPLISQSFKKPNWKEALTFSIEMYPHQSYKKIGQLPFGCHAFDVHETDFWKQFIPHLNKEA